MLLASTVILRSQSCETCDNVLLPQFQHCPSLVDQDPAFISPRNMMAQFYPQALGSLFVAYYYLQRSWDSVVGIATGYWAG
jgi:hypothetical protein